MTISTEFWSGSPTAITFEFDPRHVDMIINDMGMVNGKGSDVMGSAVDQSEGEEELGKGDAFRECGSA